MFHIILRIIAILITSYITKVGIDLVMIKEMPLEAVMIAGIVYIFLAVVNHTIKPVLHIISFPINVLTLGGFSLVINGAMIILASKIIDGFSIPTFIMGMWFAFVLSIVNFALHIFELWER